MQRWRERHGKTSPKADPPSADALRQENAELMRRLKEALKAKPAPSGEAARIRELERELETAKMQVHDLADFARANAPNLLVMSLQTEIKSLKAKLAHEKAQAIPPSEREANLRKASKILAASLRKLRNQPPKGTLIMSRRDKLKVIKCLHPDKRAAMSEREITEAFQIFNALKILEP